METRPFGRTGTRTPILSLGTQRLNDEEGCTQDEALAIRYALGLPLTTIIVGCSTMAQEEALQHRHCEDLCN